MPMRRFYRHFALLLTAIGSCANVVRAADSNKINFALLGGLAFPSFSSGAFTYGVKANYRVLPTFLPGAYYIKYGIGIEAYDGVTSVLASTSCTLYGIEGILNFSSGFSAGIRWGYINTAPTVTASDTINNIQLSNSSTSMTMGPLIVYDVPVSAFLVVGGETSYFYSFSSSQPKVITLLAHLKLSF
jgi:hypothetical protein